MRHFSLMKLLSFSSFTAGDCLQTTSGIRRSHRLESHVSSSTNEDAPSDFDRRKALVSILGGSVALSGLSPVFALDMDAFMNSELEADTKNCDPKKDAKCIPKLTPDQAMCKYGQSGEVRGEACKRVKEAGGQLSKPGASQGKSLGGAYAM